MKEIFKTLVLVAFVGLLALLQVSYAPFWASLNLLAFLAVLVNLVEDPKERMGIIFATAAGLFIDIYSSGFFGEATLLFFAGSLAVKYILSRYVRIPSLSWLPKI